MFRIYFNISEYFYISGKQTIDVVNIFSVNYKEDFYNSHIWLCDDNKIVFDEYIQKFLKKRSVKI